MEQEFLYMDSLLSYMLQGDADLFLTRQRLYSLRYISMSPPRDSVTS
ncbi:hypothetical protein FVEG_07008 [Fusarium verticillioides 7600]|uniref:Uncharacterized protein n=1 Tax=Gibberella moniliformis (strain M3125 / FGSC 7600) TaxID=334819 RepID=W7M6E5_GIBM7|nr:hypothetical protein FVEG_07008 [Fusarium verticillioides 7600]EWG46576.1 hypothetical protein FVEG_07008 [Fusarium verticillioides 7600]